jgi:exosortase/archaeosortase family protein
MSILEKINEVIKKYNLYALREVALFMIITLVIHYSFRAWAGPLQFYPIRELVLDIRGWLSETVYYQSKYIILNIMRLDVVVDDTKQIMYFPNNGYLGVNMSCSGFKQLLQLIILFLVYPGPWKHKVWYIPGGTLLVYFTNILRILSLALVVQSNPANFDVAHDYIVRPFFYVVIFAMWVIWVEKFYTRRMKPVKKSSGEPENPTEG